jgi:nicotinate-nucleotide adenylyltransferase
MNIGFFGGTFDPIHNGHLALARAAREQCKLGCIYFVPTGVPPHKEQPLATFTHRYAMVALATREEKSFVPSLLEAPAAAATPVAAKKKSTTLPDAEAVNYSIDTVRRLKQTFKKADRLFFLIGIDAFKDIAKWRDAEALFCECEFVVSSRPGYSLADVAEALPEKLRPKKAVTAPFAKQSASGDLVLPGVTVHLLDGVRQNVSATVIRKAVAEKKSLGKFLDPAVADYIKKTELYKS